MLKPHARHLNTISYEYIFKILSRSRLIDSVTKACIDDENTIIYIITFFSVSDLYDSLHR
jgi:hypothetical protein